MSVKTKNRKPHKTAAVSEIIQAQTEFWGEAVCWNPRAGDGLARTFTQVKSALLGAGLDDSVAKELLPRHAFSRAAKILEDERVIDQVLDEGNVLTFQFTKRSLNKVKGTDAAGNVTETTEAVYAKETSLTLDKATGKVSCPVAELEAQAQAEVDRRIQERTATDISNIVQKLFEKNAALIRWRDQGGAYLVPQEHVAFTEKIDLFLTALKSHIDRLPIPKGTAHGDRTVQRCFQDHMDGLIKDHHKEIQRFGEDTQARTIERRAAAIRETGVKIEAYAHYLGEKREELLDSLETERRGLIVTVWELAGASGGVRRSLYGSPCDRVLRQLGKDGWSASDAKTACEFAGVSVPTEVAFEYVGQGARGEGNLAKLSAEQVGELKESLTAPPEVEEDAPTANGTSNGDVF